MRDKVVVFISPCFMQEADADSEVSPWAAAGLCKGDFSFWFGKTILALRLQRTNVTLVSPLVYCPDGEDEVCATNQATEALVIRNRGRPIRIDCGSHMDCGGCHLYERSALQTRSCMMYGRAE